MGWDGTLECSCPLLDNAPFSSLLLPLLLLVGGGALIPSPFLGSVAWSAPSLRGAAFLALVDLCFEPPPLPKKNVSLRRTPPLSPECL